MKLPNINLFKRTFISLVITPTSLKAVKINTKTNTVTKFAESQLTPGIIMNYRVKERAHLVAAIVDLWAKNKIREKYVGVVVPEFSTYTKNLELPNLSDIEINEALGYRLQEFLPTTIDDVVFDWKIIKREKDKAEVLVVAILKDILLGYIDAVGEAGLSPLVVETPSLSLARLLDTDKTAKLMIYMNAGEAILVISNGSQIIASSVIASGDIKVVVSTARQMLTHYTTVAVQKVIVSGIGITQDLVQFLSYNLGRSVSFANVVVKGLLPGQVQDLLVGISLQHTDPIEPRSELTVNLLPPAWAEYYKKQTSGINAWTLTLVSSIIIWSAFLFVMFVFMFLSLQAEELKSSGVEAKSQELNQVVAEVKDINTLAESVSAFENDTVEPGVIINLLKSTVPQGVALNHYKVNYESGEIVLGGTAVSRSALLIFKDNLESREELEEIELPISNLIPDADINFELRALYKAFKVEKKGSAKLKLR